MRRTLAWIAGALGAAGALKALRRRPELVEEGPDPRADELRRRLEEAKPIVAERDEFEAGETPVDRADPEAGADPEAKRQDVHERARAAIDEMRRDEPTPPA